MSLKERFFDVAGLFTVGILLSSPVVWWFDQQSALRIFVIGVILYLILAFLNKKPAV